MKFNQRLLALTVLGFGLIPSFVVSRADAVVPNHVDLQRHCRARLGFGQTEPIYGSQVLQLRRCIDNTAKQYMLVSRALRRTGRSHYYARGQQNLMVHSKRPAVVVHGRRETQRSLNTRVQREEKNRINYYHKTPLQTREFLLQDHRRSRRLVVQEAERRLVRQRRAKHQRWRQAITTCRYFARDGRHDCERYHLSR